MQRGCGAGFVLTAGSNLGTFRRIGVAKMNEVPGSNIVFLWSSLATLGISVLQVVNLIFLGAFWPFFTHIVFLRLLALLQFARLVLLRPGSTPPGVDPSG